MSESTAFTRLGTFMVSVNGVRTGDGAFKVQIIAPIEADGLLLSPNEALGLVSMVKQCAERLKAMEQVMEFNS